MLNRRAFIALFGGSVVAAATQASGQGPAPRKGEGWAPSETPTGVRRTPRWRPGRRSAASRCPPCPEPVVAPPDGARRGNLSWRRRER
jgi:hypothetical protein